MAKMKYQRDGRSPIPNDEVTSKVMSANKGKNTKPELVLRKALFMSGVRGYRLHWKKAPGRPDICWPGRKIAVFVNGCYWHRCTHCDLPLPKSNTEWWKEKFGKNVTRDQRKLQELKDADWKVLTIWECEIKENTEYCVVRIKNELIRS